MVVLVAMRRAGKQGRGGGLGGVVGVKEEGVAVWRQRAWRRRFQQGGGGRCGGVGNGEEEGVEARTRRRA